MPSRIVQRAVAVGIVCWLAAGHGLAQSTQPVDDDLKTTLEAMKQRIRDQDRRIAELESRQGPPTTQTADAFRQQVVHDVMQELQADASKRTTNTAAWMENLKFAGDFRLRYELNSFDWGSTDDKEKKDRNRARFRLRFGFVKTWLDDQIEVGFRLASGSDNDPTSTNQTFDTTWSKKPVWIDLAYAKYKPKDVKGLVLIGGKMITPWVENEIFLDRDVNPEGIWAQYTAPKMGPVEPFVGGGFFSVQESADGYDSTMSILQAGVNADITKDIKYTLAANYQEWQRYDVSGATPRGNDSPLAQIPGFRIINVSNALTMPLCGKPLEFFADLAHNSGATDPKDDYQGQDTAWAAGVKWGQNKKQGDWSVKYRYGHVEANSLPGMFVDSDFGSGNRQGHVVGGEYNLMNDLTVGVNVFLTQPIFSPSTTKGSSATENMTTTVMADLLWKF